MSENPISVLLVDDHVLVRQGLRMLLENHSDIHVTGEVATADEALEIAGREEPDVVLLDLDLGENQSGLDIIARLGSLGHSPRVLVLTGIRDPEIHRRAIRLGAVGIILKEQAGEVLVKAVRCVHNGEVWIDRRMTAAIFQDFRRLSGERELDSEAARIESLTRRERELIGLVAQGFGTTKIADTLFISEKTVRNHLASIYDKLQVSDRLELAIYAVRHKLAKPLGESG